MVLFYKSFSVFITVFSICRFFRVIIISFHQFFFHKFFFFFSCPSQIMFVFFLCFVMLSSAGSHLKTKPPPLLSLHGLSGAPISRGPLLSHNPYGGPGIPRGPLLSHVPPFHMGLRGPHGPRMPLPALKSSRPPLLATPGWFSSLLGAL